MILATNLFIAYMIYIVYIYGSFLISKERRHEHQQKQKRLIELRNISIKTEEEQKEFIDLKYPKTEPFKWTLKNIILGLLKIILIIIVFKSVKWFWRTYILFEFALWEVLIIMVVLPILINMIFKHFNLQHDDIRIFFGGGRK